MMTKNLQRKLKNTGLALSLALGIAALTGATANAQNRDDDDYNRDQRIERRDDQYNQQTNNRRDNDRYRRDDRNNNNGYYGSNNNNNGYYGNNNGYYGNNNGYYGNNSGYYGNNGGNNVYRMAQQYGYQDGYNKGIEDAREGHNNPQGTSTYRNGLNGYNGSMGNREAYRQAYRQAFLQGFANAQNQTRGNNGYYNRGNGNYYPNRRGY